MKSLRKSSLVLFAMCAMAEAAFAQVPASNDTSDGDGNTGMGNGALGGTGGNNTGSDNTASGSGALYANTSGGYNTASGYQALTANTTGSYNAAMGYLTLPYNQGGNYNAAIGAGALYSNLEGSDNTASGYQALHGTTNGGYNTATGMNALYSNETGNYNVASGYQALYTNKGTANTATGVEALFRNTTGRYNIAEGYKAGLNLTTGDYNIDIGSEGTAGDSETIRIGTQSNSQSTQKATFIAGITNATVAPMGTLAISSSGQLGIVSSSERFKTAIAPMGSVTSRLDELRPVTFQYKSEPHGARQYGLIAEEVAKVYPDLVVRDAKGQILSVRYDELAPMLLNVVQEQEQRAAEQAEEIRVLQVAVRALQSAQHAN